MEKLAQYFQLGPSEQRGLFVLLLLLVVLTIVRSLPDKRVFYDINYFQITEDSAQKLEGRVLELKATSGTSAFLPGAEFDLNELSAREMRSMGFPSHWIDSVFRYKRMHGFVRSETDLMKLCGTDSSMFRSLQPYVLYKFAQKESRVQLPNESPGRSKAPVNINLAAQEELESLPGIGEVLARRIIRFRDALGGFCHISQLSEVYGLDSAKIDRLLSRVTCNGKISKLKINELSADELSKHPYISRKMAAHLTSYRSQHGTFNDLNSLKSLVLLKDVDLSKLEPYLDFSESPD